MEPSVGIMYHGTSSVFTKAISEYGLLPSPPQRNYRDDNSGWQSTHNAVYITGHLEWAESYARNASRNFGGQPLIVTVEVDMRDVSIDEDSIIEWMNEWGFDWFDIDYNRYAIDHNYANHMVAHAADSTELRFKLHLPWSGRDDFIALFGMLMRAPKSDSDVESGCWASMASKHPSVSRHIRKMLFYVSSTIPGTIHNWGDESFEQYRHDGPIGFTGSTRIVEVGFKQEMGHSR